MSSLDISELRKKYPHSAIFTSIAKVIKPSEKQQKIAVASLDKLAGVFGEDISEKIKNNPDLLYIASNLIQLNYANLNDDCVMAEDIVPYVENFINKYLDLEHSRNIIVGVITNVGFSLLGSNEVINEEIALNQIDPPAVLNIGGVLWKLVDKDLCNLTEESSVLKDDKISTSFELLFMSYDIGIGKNGDRNAKNAFVIKSTDESFEKYNKLLRKNGGSGKTENGDIVFCILKDILPIGAGIVANPASGIKGVLAVTEPEQLNENVDKADDMDYANKTKPEEVILDPRVSDNAVLIDDIRIEQNKEMINLVDSWRDKETKKSLIENNIILTESGVSDNNSTNLNINNNMELPKIEKIEDIVAKWSELQKNEASASVVTEYIKSELIAKSKEFAAELAKKDELYKTVEANKVEIEAKAKELEANVEKLNTELAEIKAAQAAAEAQDLFNSRMAALDEEFELDDEDRSYLSQEVKSLESDEAFAKYMGKQKKLMAGKKKKPADPKKDKPDADDKNGKPDVEPDADDPQEKAKKAKAAAEAEAMKQVVASLSETPNQDLPNDPNSQISLKDQVKAAFSAKTTVGGKRLKKDTK